MHPSLDIVIVNWNSGRQLRECLDSIDAADCSSLDLQRVVVVDNASTDGEKVETTRYRIPLQWIQNPVNRGFAAACNQGARHSHADLVLFLNPDTRVSRSTLAQSAEAIRRMADPSVGILGIALHHEDGSLACTCSRFPSPSIILCEILGLNRLFPSLCPSHLMTRRDPAQSGFVDQVIGAFFLVRREVFDALDGFDERFFVYYEEVDFARRALDMGWKCFYFAETEAFHEGGGASRHAASNRLFHLVRSRLRYCQKHMGFVPTIILTLATLIIEPWTRLCSDLLRRQWRMTVSNLVAACKLWMTLPFLFVPSGDLPPMEDPGQNQGRA